MGYHANLLVESTIPPPPVKEPPQLAKRSAPFDSLRPKRRIEIEDDSDDEDEELLPDIAKRTKKVNTPVPRPQFVKSLQLLFISFDLTYY